MEEGQACRVLLEHCHAQGVLLDGQGCQDLVPDGGGKKAGSLHLFSLWLMEIADGTDYLEG